MKCSNVAATKYYAIPEGYDKESVVQIKCVGANSFILSVDGKDIEVDFLGNPICPHQTHPHYAIIARCICCPKSENCPDRDKIMKYKNKPRMDINELKRKKRLLETKIDILIATFLDENKDIHIRDVDIKISDVRNQSAKEEVASFVETTITLTL